MNPVQEKRRQALTALWQSRFEENTSALARAAGRKQPFMSELLKGKRSFGEKLARDLETALDLADSYFDHQATPAATASAPAARKPKRKTTADVICEKVYKLDPSVQQHLLMLIETILAASNPRAISYESAAHRQALAVHERRARHAK